MKRARIILVLILLVAMAGRFTQVELGEYVFSQVASAERIPLEGSPADLGIPFESVEFQSAEDDVLLRGWYLPNSTRCAIIIVHGLDDNRASSSVGYLGIAGKIYKRGCSIFMFDLRGHGQSADGELSGGYFEQRDLLGAYTWLKNREPRARIGVLGVSMGAAISILVAAKEPGIKAVVADSSFANLTDMIKSEVPKRSSLPSVITLTLIPELISVAEKKGIYLEEVAPEKVIGELGYPVLLVHCLGDERVSVKHSLRLFKLAPEGSDLLTPPCKTHARAFKDSPDLYIDIVWKYFRSRLLPQSGQGQL